MAASSSMSGCVSKDVEHERKTKRKHMVAVVEPEPESESESNSEDDSSSEDGAESSSEEESSPVKQQLQKKMDDGSESEAVLNSDKENSSDRQNEQKTMITTKTKVDEMKHGSKSQSGEEPKEDEIKGGSKSESGEDESSEEEETSMEEDDTKKTIQSSNIQKGEDVSKKQVIEIQRPNDASNSRFTKKYCPEDEVKVLHELLCKGEKRGTRLFWRTVKDSMQLSFPATETQLYEKTRGLKERYTSRLKNNEFSMDEQERKVFELSEKVWGKVENVKPRQMKKAKKTMMEFDHMEEYKCKYDEFERAFSKKKDGEFPVAEALDVVPVTRRANLEKKWKDVFDLKMELHMRRTMAEFETLAAVANYPWSSLATIFLTNIQGACLFLVGRSFLDQPSRTV